MYPAADDLCLFSINTIKRNLPIRILPDSFKVGVPVVTMGTLSVPNVKSPEMVTFFLNFHCSGNIIDSLEFPNAAIAGKAIFRDDTISQGHI